VTSVEPEKLVAGDRRTLARAITLIESSAEADRREAALLLKTVLPKTGRSLRIAVTGAPGVGKSTFINVLGLHLIGRGHKIAVLAIDPTSPRSGGSILGDKTRMEELAKEQNAFIRPSPAGDHLGGVAHRTREALLLCEAAGFDVVVVETVGVGQSEVEVASMVDFVIVLVQPNAGDELQGIKRGIVEFADLIVVNKAEGESVAAAARAQAEYQGALRLRGNAAVREPRALTCSARDRVNIDLVWQDVEESLADARDSGALERRRADQDAAQIRVANRRP
jgi:LAO/AO transport system kinase